MDTVPSRPWRATVDVWSVTTVLLAVLILAPMAVVLSGLFRAGPDWSLITETVLWTYVGNTLLLTLTVCLLSLLMAVPAAWVLSAFQFPGKKFFEWAMVLPLALPTYVAAFVYMSVKESALPAQVWIRQQWGQTAFDFSEAFLRHGLLSLLMASVLYPYLYLSLRGSFLVQRRGVIEAAQLLGRGPASVFLSVALPLSRPAMIAGLSLIVMELINDYGAVNFFGVPTLTEGVFRTWFNMGDRASALRLSAIMMVSVLLLLALERAQRGRARFSEPSNDTTPLAHRRLRAPAAALAMLVCLVPLWLGFLFPLYRLVTWAAMSPATLTQSEMWRRMGHSMVLALGTSVVLTLFAVLVVYTTRLHPSRRLGTTMNLSTLGYAAPGAVVAVGVMVTFAWLDRRLAILPGHWFLSGTVHAIGFAYFVRFFAVPVHPIKASMTRVCGRLDEASRLLGHAPANTLFRVNLPLVKGTLVSATMLVFVDILKELPLTMILRPANFDTLATWSFGLAKEGRLHECAVPSLAIIFLAALGLMGLNRFVRSNVS